MSARWVADTLELAELSLRELRRVSEESEASAIKPAVLARLAKLALDVTEKFSAPPDPSLALAVDVPRDLLKPYLAAMRKIRREPGPEVEPIEEEGLRADADAIVASEINKLLLDMKANPAFLLRVEDVIAILALALTLPAPPPAAIGVMDLSALTRAELLLCRAVLKGERPKPERTGAWHGEV